MPEPRYAVYWAPGAGTALSTFLNGLVGYDGHTGIAVPLTAPPGYTDKEWDSFTTGPRRYGIHATLKAPFRLKQGTPFAEFDHALRAFASTCCPVTLGPLELTQLVLPGGQAFIALTARLADPARAMAALSRHFVAHNAHASTAKIEALSLFVQVDEEAHFRKVSDYPFNGPYPFPIGL